MFGYNGFDLVVEISLRLLLYFLVLTVMKIVLLDHINLHSARRRPNPLILTHTEISKFREMHFVLMAYWIIGIAKEDYTPLFLQERENISRLLFILKRFDTEIVQNLLLYLPKCWWIFMIFIGFRRLFFYCNLRDWNVLNLIEIWGWAVLSLFLTSSKCEAKCSY